MNRFMQFIDFGGLQGGGFQNALNMGLQMGQLAGQRQSERELNNALAQFDPAKPETLQPVMQRDARVGMQLRGQMEAAQRQQQEAQLVQKAMGGDQEAMTQLATVNFDKWKAVDPAMRQKAEAETKIFGNAALDLLGTTDAAQRRQKLMGYVQQMGQQYPEVARIAQLPPDQLEAALRSAVFEAQMVDKLIAMERPDYMAIPEGGTLVNTRDPQAVQQFGAMAPQAAPTAQGNVVSMGDLQRMARGMGSADAMMNWMRRNNITVRVSTPQEAMNLPSGTPILLPDGTIGSVP